MHQNPVYHLDGGIKEDRKWQARWEKLVWLETQRYDTPYGQVGEKLISIIAVELGGILDQKWNAEQVIVFQ